MLSQVIGRFAPSPTGPLHYGSLLAAVASYLSARSKKGKWLVRLDDLDPPRAIAGASTDILQTLEYYGLNWDDEVVFQSQRNNLYRDALSKLNNNGLIYACSCSRKDIADRGEEVYQGYCRDKKRSDRSQYSRLSQRIRTTAQEICWTDLIQGKQAIKLSNSTGDFIVRRADKLFAYHLAAVIDDNEQQVTEVIRGADLLDSTAPQRYLYEALNFIPPQYGHIPIAVNSTGEKLSKKTAAPPVSMLEPASTLIKIFIDLGQNPPNDLATASVDDILRWGITNWDICAVPKLFSIKTLNQRRSPL